MRFKKEVINHNKIIKRNGLGRLNQNFKFNKVGEQLIGCKNLPEISSDFIEPYFQRFLSMQIESVGAGLITPKEAKEYLKGVEYFACFTGIHCRIATANMYGKFISLPDHELLEMCKKIFKQVA